MHTSLNTYTHMLYENVKEHFLPWVQKCKGYYTDGNTDLSFLEQL